MTTAEWIALARKIILIVERELKWNTMAGQEHWQLILVRVHQWDRFLAARDVQAEHPVRERLEELAETIALGLSPTMRAAIDESLRQLEEAGT